MQLLEYTAKSLFQSAGIPIPDGRVVTKTDLPQLQLPVVLKSQVPVGGRGKAGGIQVVTHAEQLNDIFETLVSLPIKDHLPSAIYAEELVDIEHEFYLSLNLNRDQRCAEWIISPQGGVDIEENSQTVSVFSYDNPQRFELIAQALQIEKEQLAPILQKIENCFFDNDCLLIEINPFVLTKNATFICADAKVMVDDNAAFRHPELSWPKASPLKLLGGTIGVIANGAGMAMSTMDTIYISGLKPANFLDIGGGTGADIFVTYLQEINNLPHVSAIIVNIFAGITHCDDIARGIVEAKQQIPDLAPLFIRLEGTNYLEAVEILQKANIQIEPTLEACIKKAKEVS